MCEPVENGLVTAAEWVVLIWGNDDTTSTVTGPATASITASA
jgi:hypothetical protein